MKTGKSNRHYNLPQRLSYKKFAATRVGGGLSVASLAALMILALFIPYVNADNSHNLGSVQREFQARQYDAHTPYIVSGCMPADPGSGLALASFSCASYVSDGTDELIYVNETAAITIADATPTWLAVCQDRHSTVTGWTRQSLTHYVYKQAASQPADPNGCLVFSKVTVSGSNIDTVTQIADRRVTTSTAISADQTISGEVTIPRGGIFVPANGITVTFTGPIDAGVYQICDTSSGGDCDFTNAKIPFGYPQWFGVDDTGTTDSTTLLTTAFTYLTHIYMPCGTYIYGTSDDVTIPASSPRIIEGNGRCTLLKNETANANDIRGTGFDQTHFSQGTAYDIGDASEGDTTVTTDTPSEAGNFVAGDWAYLRANMNDGDGGGENEPKNFEFNKVSSVDAGTGVVTFYWPLQRSYDSNDAGYEPEIVKVEDLFSRDVTIRNLAVEGGTAKRINMIGPNWLVENIWCRAGASSSQGRCVGGIALGFSTVRNVIIDEPPIANGFQFSQGVHNLVLENNKLLGVSSTGILLEEGPYNVIVRDNVVGGDVSTDLINVRNDHNPERIIVANNLIFGADSVDGLGMGGSEVIAYGNIASDTARGFHIDTGEANAVFGNIARANAGTTAFDVGNQTGSIVGLNIAGDASGFASNDDVVIDGNTHLPFLGNIYRRATNDDGETDISHTSTMMLAFSVVDIAGSATATADNSFGLTDGYTMPAAGSVVGFAVSMNDARTAGTVTFQLQVSTDDGDSWSNLNTAGNIVIDGTDTRAASITFPPQWANTQSFASGDRIRVRAVSSSYTPDGSVDASISAWVQLGSPRG